MFTERNKTEEFWLICPYTYNHIMNIVNHQLLNDHPLPSDLNVIASDFTQRAKPLDPHCEFVWN